MCQHCKLFCVNCARLFKPLPCFEDTGCLTRLHCADKLPFHQAPPDTDGLPDMHLALYNEVIIFDQATKLAYLCVWLHLDDHPTLEAAYAHGQQRLAALTACLGQPDASALSPAKVLLDVPALGSSADSKSIQEPCIIDFQGVMTLWTGQICQV